jgi:hypothetical protein
MERWVEIEFDCLPLRSVGRLEPPLDASPAYRAFCTRIGEAIEKHGTHNSYFLHHAQCTFHLTNHPDLGFIRFQFQGVVLTDSTDQRTIRSDLDVEMHQETCDWLSQPIVEWFSETVSRAVEIEFDRYIQAGDLDQAKQRIAKLQEASDESGGFLGMYL